MRIVIDTVGLPDDVAGSSSSIAVMSSSAGDTRIRGAERHRRLIPREDKCSRPVANRVRPTRFEHPLYVHPLYVDVSGSKMTKPIRLGKLLELHAWNDCDGGSAERATQTRITLGDVDSTTEASSRPIYMEAWVRRSTSAIRRPIR